MLRATALLCESGGGGEFECECKRERECDCRCNIVGGGSIAKKCRDKRQTVWGTGTDPEDNPDIGFTAIGVMVMVIVMMMMGVAVKIL